MSEEQVVFSAESPQALKREIVINSIDNLIDKISQDWHDGGDYLDIQTFANEVCDAFRVYDTDTDELEFNYWHYIAEGCTAILNKLGVIDFATNYRNDAAVLYMIKSHKLNKNQILQIFHEAKKVKEWRY